MMVRFDERMKSRNEGVDEEGWEQRWVRQKFKVINYIDDRKKLVSR